MSSEIRFTQSTESVEAYDCLEVVVGVTSPGISNPFTDVRVTGTFHKKDGTPLSVDGFCDSQDGSVHRIRFMPSSAGSYTYSVSYRDASGARAEHSGTFEATDGERRGVLRVDRDHPWSFVWEGTGEHCFWNGTTTYYLMGWRDDAVIRDTIDRLSGLGVNRLRVLVYGRNHDRPWGQPVVNTDAFAMRLNPWVAKWPDDMENPEFDLSRFEVGFWQKYERLVAHARAKDVIVSVIFHIGGQILPVPYLPYSEDEVRYYRYAAARLGAYSNVTWDIGNEHNFHRDTHFWPRTIGGLMRRVDPYRHLVGAHNVVYHQEWPDMQLIQTWDAGLNAFLLEKRAAQQKSGRIVPQVIEEYGYEDLWEKRPGHRATDTRRRCAWEVYMAGCHQTNGETTRTGCGVEPDTGGGWVSGRGDDSMTMFESYRHIRDFFTSFAWWRAEPHNELVTTYDYDGTSLPPYYTNRDAKQVTEFNALCLAEPGKAYAVWLPVGGSVELSLEDGTYAVTRFDPLTGARSDEPQASGASWTSPKTDGPRDWAFLLTRD